MADFERLISFFEEGIPLHRFLGVRVVQVEDGRATLRLSPRPELVGDPWRPALHGGALAMLADAAGGLATFSRLQRQDRTSTVDLRMDFLRPARTDEDLYAVAELLRLGNRVAVVDVHLYQGEERARIAEGRGVYNVIRPEEG